MWNDFMVLGDRLNERNAACWVNVNEVGRKKLLGELFRLGLVGLAYQVRHLVNTRQGGHGSLCKLRNAMHRFGGSKMIIPFRL